MSINVSVSQAAHADKATADKYGADIADNYIKHYINISTQDLNDFRVGGLYAQPLNANATTARHYPENEACSILVIQNGANGVDGCTQICTTFSSHNSYKREYDVTSKAWSAWRKYAFADSTVACATKLATPRTISLTGNASGSGTFDGSGNVSINTTVSQAANAERIRGESFWSNNNNYLLIGTLTIGQNGGAFGIKIQSGNFFNDGIESYSREVSLYFRASNGSTAKYSAYAEYHRYGSAGMNFFINETSDNTYDIYLGPLMWSGNSICIPILSTACSFDKKYTNVSALPTGAKKVNSYRLVYTDTVNNYAPTKTGSGASGTWDISITGNADTVDGYHASDLLNQAMRVGVVLPFSGSTIPSGYLPCNGAAVSRTTYKALFDVIGTLYGTGDGSTTFNLPNLIDKFIEGSTTVGTVKAAGLPNITGNVTHVSEVFNFAGSADGAFTKAKEYSANWTPRECDVSDTGKLLFNASKSNAIYGASDTVQPPAVTMQYIIKY